MTLCPTYTGQQEGVYIQPAIHVKTDSGRISLSFFLVQKGKLHMYTEVTLVESYRSTAILRHRECYNTTG